MTHLLAVYNSKYDDYSLYNFKNGIENIRPTQSENTVWVTVKDGREGALYTNGWMKFMKTGKSLINLPLKAFVSPASAEGRHKLLSARRYPIVKIIRGPRLLDDYSPITPIELPTDPELWIEPAPSSSAKPSKSVHDISPGNLY